MNRRNLLFWISLSLLGAGCSGLENAPHPILRDHLQYSVHSNQFRKWSRVRHQANDTWMMYCDAARCASSPDYSQGFKDGFADQTYYGGPCTAPAVPPRQYWNDHYRSPAGYQAIQQWYAGFHEGAYASRMSGQRSLATVPSDHSQPLLAGMPMAQPMQMQMQMQQVPQQQAPQQQQQQQQQLPPQQLQPTPAPAAEPMPVPPAARTQPPAAQQTLSPSAMAASAPTVEPQRIVQTPPVSQPVAQPVTQPAVQPVAPPIAEPVAQQVAQQPTPIQPAPVQPAPTPIVQLRVPAAVRPIPEPVLVAEPLMLANSPLVVTLPEADRPLVGKRATGLLPESETSAGEAEAEPVAVPPAAQSPALSRTMVGNFLPRLASELPAGRESRRQLAAASPRETAVRIPLPATAIRNSEVGIRNQMAVAQVVERPRLPGEAVASESEPAEPTLRIPQAASPQPSARQIAISEVVSPPILTNATLVNLASQPTETRNSEVGIRNSESVAIRNPKSEIRNPMAVAQVVERPRLPGDAVASESEPAEPTLRIPLEMTRNAAERLPAAIRNPQSDTRNQMVQVEVVEPPLSMSGSETSGSETPSVETPAAQAYRVQRIGTRPAWLNIRTSHEEAREKLNIERPTLKY